MGNDASSIEYNAYMKKLGMPDQTFVHIKSRQGHPEVQGTPSYSLGHKIDRGVGAKPDGIFFEWAWDGKRLTVTNDRYGLYPLYYSHDEGAVCVSPSIRAVLAQGAANEFDYDALSVFLRLGFFMGEDTPFKHIKVLPPDATFIYEDGKLTISGRYAMREPIQISEDDAIDEYTRLFRQAMKRRLPGKDEKFLFPLSGGRDSRHILLELHHQGYKPDYAVTMRPYPPFYAEDIRISKLLSKELGIKHLSLEHQKSYFANELRSLEMTNYCSDEHAWFLELADYFKGRTQVSYDGIAGDVFPAGSFLDEELSTAFHKLSYTEVCKTLFRDWSWMRPSDHVLKWSLGEDFFKKISEERAIARITEELKKHSPAHNPVTSFYFWTETRRTIALMSYAVNVGVPKMYSPFLDYDLYDFLAAIPEKLNHDGALHDKTIARAYPQFARIPYEQNDAQKISVSDHRSKFTREFAWYALQGNLGHSQTVKSRYLWPRMVKCLMNKEYCASLWRLMPPTLLYLIQLEKLQNLKGRTR